MSSDLQICPYEHVFCLLIIYLTFLVFSTIFPWIDHFCLLIYLFWGGWIQCTLWYKTRYAKRLPFLRGYVIETVKSSGDSQCVGG